MPGSPESTLNLADDFPAHSYAQWREAAEKLLKGAPFDKRLRTRLPEGITLEPIYRRDDLAELDHLDNPFPGLGTSYRGTRAAGFTDTGWQISQALWAKDPETLATVARDAFERGQSELNISLPGNAIGKTTELRSALAEVSLAQTAVFLHGEPNRLVADQLLEVAKDQGVDTVQLTGSVGFDPLGDWVQHGLALRPLSTAFDEMAQLTTLLAERAPRLQSVLVRADIYRDAGASAVEELGYGLASVVSLFRELATRGVEASTVAGHLRLVFGLGSNFFMEIAKLRAARHLLSKIFAAFGAKGRPHLHCRTSRWNKTRLDPHVNLLRGTTEAFAAVVGGADGIEVDPFDHELRKPDAFSLRTARNIQLVLAHECDLQRVADPAGGSYYVEWLTDQLARAAYASLQHIEAKGGMIDAIAAGIPQQQIAQTAKAQRDALGKRRTLLIGTNIYPIAGEALPEVPAPDIPRKQAEGPRCTPLPRQRLAEDFEQLRLTAQRQQTPPAMLQLNIGPSRHYRARADWTAGFFTVGGFTVPPAVDFEDAESALEAARENRPRLVCIVSDDKTYAEGLIPLATSLRKALPEATLCVAGAPPDEETAARWTEAGIDAVVNVRVNAFALLSELQERMGVK